MAFDTDLSDEQWSVIQPLLPARARTGRPRADDRRTLNAILWILKTGARWCDLPRELGDDSTAHRRLKRWSADGTWQRLWRTLLSTLDGDNRLDWGACAIDGSYVRAKGGATSSGQVARARRRSATSSAKETAFP